MVAGWRVDHSRGGPRLRQAGRRPARTSTR
jgi:hypothetical protein